MTNCQLDNILLIAHSSLLIAYVLPFQKKPINGLIEIKNQINERKCDKREVLSVRN